MTAVSPPTAFARRRAAPGLEVLPPRAADSLDTGSISAALVHDILGAARLSKAQAEDVLTQAGIAPASLGFHDQVTPAQFAKLWSALVTHAGDELFGLDARGMPIGSFALLCQTALNSPTLEDAIARSLQFFGLLLSDFDARLVRRDGQACIELREGARLRPAPFHLALFLMLTGYGSWLVDRRIVIDEAAFRSGEPASANQYRRLLCPNLRFDAVQASISFNAKFLSMRPNRTAAQLEGFLQRSPLDLLAPYRSCDSLPGRIWQQLRTIAPDAWPSFEALAVLLNTTPSTLRRRLDNANNSYQKIKDGVRQELAVNALRMARQPITEIAKELGYEDPSAFYRAFKKWTGLTPNAYREASLRVSALEDRRISPVA